MSAYVSAVIVAAGGSVRRGIADSKQFIPVSYTHLINVAKD